MPTGFNPLSAFARRLLIGVGGVLLVLLSLALFEQAAFGDGLDHVVQVTMEDTQGDVKTRLYRTSKRECVRHLGIIRQQTDAQPGIVRILSAKCGPITTLKGYFEGLPLDQPYLLDGREVLILRGASDRACMGLEQMMRASNPKSRAKCILPSGM